MPEPQSLRQFTPQEARETLPLVRRIVADILTTGQRARHLATELGADFRQDAKARAVMHELRDLMRELDSVGCSFKDWDFEIGLVDFPAIIDGRQVLLCWRSDEDEIRYYHTVDAGYAGRRPIPEELLG